MTIPRLSPNPKAGEARLSSLACVFTIYPGPRDPVEQVKRPYSYLGVAGLTPPFTAVTIYSDGYW